MTTEATMLAEAERLKTALLPVQEAIEKIAKNAQDKLLAPVLESLTTEDDAPKAGATLTDVRVKDKTSVLTPQLLNAVLPLSKNSERTTRLSRQKITAIIQRKDDRLLVIVGPCSLHDPEAALEYADHVALWRKKYGKDLEIVMRAYMEKPRTELGWKGLTYDPKLDESADLNLGLIVTRLLTRAITDKGVPIAMERLNALTPQYVNALVAYDAIGARNTTDQKSREYASATSSPVGFKNTPEGSIEAAIQAIVAARAPHAFLGMGMNGAPNRTHSQGNDTAHVILRGDAKGPNYSARHITRAKQQLAAKGLPESIVIDASHGNSRKIAANQPLVITSVAKQVSSGEAAINGIMIESNLLAGAQKLSDPSKLIYGQSITDECVGLVDTETMLAKLAASVVTRRQSSK